MRQLDLKFTQIQNDEKGNKDREFKKTKGVKIIVSKTLLFGYFEICAYNARTKTTLKSEKHNVFIVKKNKIAMHKSDDKEI